MRLKFGVRQIWDIGEKNYFFVIAYRVFVFVCCGFNVFFFCCGFHVFFVNCGGVSFLKSWRVFAVFLHREDIADLKGILIFVGN